MITIIRPDSSQRTDDKKAIPLKATAIHVGYGGADLRTSQFKSFLDEKIFEESVFLFVLKHMVPCSRRVPTLHLTLGQGRQFPKLLLKNVRPPSIHQ